MDILAKLDWIKNRFTEVGQLITDPEVISDMKRYVALNKEYKELEELVAAYDALMVTEENILTNKELLKSNEEPDLKEMAAEELATLEQDKTELEERIKIMLLPKDPEDEKNAIMELRAGTGGDEACIFVEDVFRMYTMYFKNKDWSFEVLNSTEGTVKGFKEIVMEVSGEGVFGTLKYESGVHRVQRVPETESQGRVHTSAISVAVLPEVEDIDFVLDLSEVKKDTFRASGAGGQHINKTESAIRLTHIPTGIVAECQDNRSQHRNYERALQVLRSRLYQIELDKKMQERANQRKLLVSTGDRSAKIRTYNYPQGRITDHRINKTSYNLTGFMNGDLVEMIDALKTADNAEALKDNQTE